MTRFLNISTDNTLGGLSPSDEFVASQKAIKEYVDNNSSNVQVDNLTINTNASDEIQTIAAINQNSGILKFWKGSKLEYDNLPSHDPDTQYTVTGDNTAGMMPTGSIIPFAGTNIPDGYLLCDGSAISRTTYADLFAVIGTVYGTGDGSTTFNLPIIQGNTNVNMVPTGTYDNLSWGDNHTAPANGWFSVQLRSITTSAFIGLTNLTNGMTRYLWGSISGANYSVFLPARKGDVIQAHNTDMQWASDSFYRFYYTQNYNNAETRTFIKY